jgi:site-specific DNA recombinase
MKSNGKNQARQLIRCAVYTRKSTEEGLEQEFNSLDAQRESGEAYVKSQAHEGWNCLGDRYDDGGFTGGNMDRPALKRLLTDIEAGKVDCVVVYKVDRLSRSLLDFARIMEVFDKHGVAFVSVTQLFNTANSMGRLMLNVLLSFAQFEREIISERTRDKIAAARRKGKWSGGMPLLGYDVDANSKLVVNQDEARRVQAIFELYLEHRALLPVVQELERRGWTNKCWTTRKGGKRGGKPFTRPTLHRLLINPTFIGKVRYKNETHDGEHEAIIGLHTWQQVQATLQRNGHSGGAVVRNKYGALLKGLLRCAPCGCAMFPSHTTRNGNKRYRYYVCTAAQKRGWNTCPSKSIPAGEVERFVVDQIRCIGKDAALAREVLQQANGQARVRIEQLKAEQRSIERDLAYWHEEIQRLANDSANGGNGSPALGRLADLQERIRVAERRQTEVGEELLTLDRQSVDEQLVTQALAQFDAVWGTLSPQEQARIVHLIVEQIEYDGAKGRISVIFYPTGIRTLADELAQKQKEGR